MPCSGICEMSGHGFCKAKERMSSAVSIDAGDTNEAKGNNPGRLFSWLNVPHKYTISYVGYWFVVV